MQFGAVLSFDDDEVAQHLGAERYQRSPDRQGERNGYRDRNWDTRVGTLELRVPRVRDGSFFPGLLEPSKRAERALVATAREAYVQGVSTRRVDDLVKALGWTASPRARSVVCARSWMPRRSASAPVSSREATRTCGLTRPF
jgi:putative transposase